MNCRATPWARCRRISCAILTRIFTPSLRSPRKGRIRLMNQEQAAEINRHLQRAANAIRRAEAIMWDLDQVDRKAFAEPLGNTVTALHFELLQVIYRQFPDLRPPDKGWRRIDSRLKWKQVQLPASVTVMDFDRVILS